jgi:hypothetical protein
MDQGQPNHSGFPLSRDHFAGRLAGWLAEMDAAIRTAEFKIEISGSPDVDRAAADRPRRAVVLRRRVQTLQYTQAFGPVSHQTEQQNKSHLWTRRGSSSVTDAVRTWNMSQSGCMNSPRKSVL